MFDRIVPRLATAGFTVLLGLWAGFAVGIFLATGFLFADGRVPRSVAGDIAGRILDAFSLARLVMLPLVIATTAVVAVHMRQSHTVNTVRVVLLGLLLALTLTQVLALNPLVSHLREKVAIATDEARVADAEALRARFNKVHGYAMLAQVGDVVWTVGLLLLTFLAPPVVLGGPLPSTDKAAGTSIDVASTEATPAPPTVSPPAPPASSPAAGLGSSETKPA